MPEPLLRALSRVRAELLAAERLVRAVGSGRQRGTSPPWRRAELRYVDLKSGRVLQSVTFDSTQSFTKNHAIGAAARDAVDDLLEIPFGHWRVETTERTLQLRCTKKGEAVLSESGPPTSASAGGAHDREKPRLLPADDPMLRVLGISDAQGRVKPTRRAKYHQVEELLRLLDPTVTKALDAGRLRRPSQQDPLRVVDLGCGNAYLTFAVHRHLASAGLPVRLVGVDAKAQSLTHNTEVAARLGIEADFVQGSIAQVELDQPPDVVLALHACDTATDDALARAVAWQAPLVLAAPCCHHDVAAQLRRAPTPAPYGALTRDGILRERLADTLTDALRAQLLRLHGYRCDVVEFVGSQHTPRNSLIRATRTGTTPRLADQRDYADLVSAWRLEPRLAGLLAVQAADAPRE